MLIVEEKIQDSIRRHGEKDYPEEAGGLLVGRFLKNGIKEALEIYPIGNARLDSRHNRILLLPADVLGAERFARSKALDIVGFYHSHPNAAAVPSQYDLDHALPIWSYVIVSVIQGKPDDLRSWEMQEDRSRFNEEKIETSMEQ